MAENLRIYLIVISCLTILLTTKACPSNQCFCFMKNAELDCSQLEMRYLPNFEPENKTFHILDISGNKLKRLDAYSFKHLRVRKIRLLKNTNKNLYIHKDAFQGLDNELAIVHFRRNNIPVLPTGLFDKMRRLRHIELPMNHIQHISKGAFKGAKNAYTLQLDRNDLRQIEGKVFKGMKYLKNLTLVDNMISYIDMKAFSGLKSLEFLHLQQNNIRDLQPKTFKRTMALKWLDLSMNRISAVFPLMFKGLHNLEFLSLADNPIMMLGDGSFHAMDNLHELLLSNTDLNILKSGMFKGLETVETLDLGRNKIENLDEHIFYNLQNLKSISLNDNKLSTLTPCVFRDVHSVESIFIENNPMLCDCSVRWTSYNNTPMIFGRCVEPQAEYNKHIAEKERYDICTFSGMECMMLDGGSMQGDQPMNNWLRYRMKFRKHAVMYNGR